MINWDCRLDPPLDVAAERAADAAGDREREIDAVRRDLCRGLQCDVDAADRGTETDLTIGLTIEWERDFRRAVERTLLAMLAHVRGGQT